MIAKLTRQGEIMACSCPAMFDGNQMIDVMRCFGVILMH